MPLPKVAPRFLSAVSVCLALVSHPLLAQSEFADEALSRPPVARSAIQATPITVSFSPASGSVISTRPITIQVTWCNANSGVWYQPNYTVYWQGFALSGASWSSAPLAGCSVMGTTATFQNVYFDPTRPLSLNATALDVVGNMWTGFTTYQLAGNVLATSVVPDSVGPLTLKRGATGTAWFTVANQSSTGAQASFSATCGAMTACTPSVSSMPLGPGASQRVAVSFVAPTTYNSSSVVKLTMSATANGGTGTTSGSTTVVTPPGDPVVTPKASAGTIVMIDGGQSATWNFRVASNPSGVSVRYTVTPNCPPHWGCFIDSSTVVVPTVGSAGVNMRVAAPPQSGGPTVPTTPVGLIASLWNDTTLISADTGVIQMRLGYHLPQISPKSTAAIVVAGAAHTDTFTVTNNGNESGTFYINGYCVPISGGSCFPSPSPVTLAAGASAKVSITYTPLATKLPGPAKLIASSIYTFSPPPPPDTATVQVSVGDVSPPTIAITPAEGATVTTRSLNAIVSVCDADGLVGAPSVVVNGTSVSGGFVTGAQAGCATAGSTTIAMTARPGANTVVATVSDGVHTTTSTRTFNYDEAVELTPAVTALTPPRLRAALAASADTFSVRNPGAISATYSLTATCTALATGCSPSPSSLTLSPGQSGTVVVGFAAGAATGSATVSLAASYTGVTNHTVSSTASTSVSIDASPPTIAVSPMGVVTALSSPTITVQWCDAEGSLANRSVTIDGAAMSDVFVTGTAEGCAAAGTSTYAGLSLSPGPHTVGATAIDGVGHATTTTTMFTFALPTLTDFRPSVVPKAQPMDVFVGVAAQRWFTIRNAGVVPATYQVGPVCPAVSCSTSKTSTTLGPGATDSALVSFTPTSGMGSSTTIGLRAAYTDATNQSIADTGTVVASVAQLASRAVPSLTPTVSSVTIEPRAITVYTFVLRNTGTVTGTYAFTPTTSADFIWPQGVSVYSVENSNLGALTTLDVAPGQSVHVYVEPAAPATAGVTGQVSLMTAFHAVDGSVSSATSSIPVFVKSPDYGIAITPNDGAPLTVSVDRTVVYHEVAFTVHNTGSLSGSYQYTPSCHGFAANCRQVAGPASGVVLAPGATTDVTIGYDATGVDGLNYVELDGSVVQNGRLGIGRVNLVASAAPPLAASVTPANDQVSPPPRSTQSVTFTITNSGGVSAAFSYAVACSGSVTACSSASGLSGSTSVLSPGAQAQVVVSYQSGDAGSSGAVSLTARSADGTVNVTGTRTVSVAAPTSLVVRAKDLNPDGNVARDQCLTIAAGADAAFECGELRLAHALPTTTTMNKPRTPALIFGSGQARPGGVVVADVSVPSSLVATAVRATLTFPAKPSVVVTRDFSWTSTLSDGRPRRLALRFEAPDWETGAYAYTFQVQAMNGATVLATASDNGVVAVVNRVASPFGRGWWLDGLEQISTVTPDTSQRLWVGGDGSTRVYSKVAQSGDSKWVVKPALDRPDTLYHTSNGGYKRRLRDSAYVTFDAAGQHDTTVNAARYRTSFAYVGGRLGSGGQLSTITLPVPAGAPAVTYRLTYVMVGSLPRLSSVAAPASSDGPRTVTIGGDAAEANRIASITDPDATVIRFGMDGQEQVVSRTDRLGHAVHFSYDATAHLVVANTVDLVGEPALVSAFCPAEGASLLACASAVLDTAMVRTKYTGPRRDLPDTSAFYLTRYGAPRKIVDAIGRVTTISRSLAAFPMLATRIDRPGGAMDSSEYDLQRALPVRTITRVDSVRYAATRIFWNATWDEADSTVAPEGELAAFTYDSRGNRKTQVSGRTTQRQVSLEYDGDNHVISILESGALGASRVYYESLLGNVDSTKSVLGIVSHVDRDGIGRVIATRTPLDQAQQHQARVETRYDVMDRDTLVATTGPRVTQQTSFSGSYDESRRDSLVVRKRYDSEGELLSLTRRVNPNPNGLAELTTTWSYDAAHRKRRETAPDLHSDTTVYGDGVNVTRTTDRRGVSASMAYDGLNRLTSRILDPATTTSPLGTITIPGSTETFLYDGFGNVREAANEFAIVDRDYNVGGTIRREVQRVATEGLQFGQHDYEIDYAYDLENRRLTMHQPWQVFEHMIGDGNPGPLQYRYNEFGDLREIGQGGGLSPFDFFYDQRGRLDSIAYPNGVGDRRVYDEDGRLTFLIDRAPSGGLGWNRNARVDTDTIQWSRMFYDAAGRIDSATTYRGSATFNGYTSQGGLVWMTQADSLRVLKGIESYTIDPLGNLQSTDLELGNLRDGGTHQYDITTGRLLSIQQRNGAPSDFVQFSSYDVAGNQIRLSRARTVSDINTNQPIVLMSDARSAYDAAGRLRTYIDTVAPHPGTTVMPEEDYTEQQTRYDALGRRVWVKTRHIPGASGAACAEFCTVERFVWDGDQLIGEFRLPDALAEQDTALVYTTVDTSTDILNPGPPVRKYSWLWGQVLYVHGPGMDQPLVVHRGGAGVETFDLSSFAMYPLHDWRGNATAVAFANGLPLLSGNAAVTPPLPTLDNSQMTAYRQRMHDSRRVTSWMGSLLTGQMTPMGLEYRRNRYYDPQSGRFTQEDPIGFGGGMNLYGFAGGDPVNYSDPFGLSTCPNGYVDSGLNNGVCYNEAGVLGLAIAGVFETAEAGVQAIESLFRTSRILPKEGSAGGPGAAKDFSESVKDAARAESKDRCVFCGTRTVRSKKPQPDRSNIDHAIPKSRGGNNELPNAQNTCQLCNLRKGALTTSEFLEKMRISFFLNRSPAREGLSFDGEDYSAVAGRRLAWLRDRDSVGGEGGSRSLPSAQRAVLREGSQ